jgi:hypothetical protein
MSLRHWSPLRIAAIWLAWPFVLACIGVVLIIIAIRNEPHAIPGRVMLPVQWSDISVEVDNAWMAGLALLGPPALLTAIWLWRRRRG